MAKWSDLTLAAAQLAARCWITITTTPGRQKRKSLGLSTVNAFQLIDYQSHGQECRSPAGWNSSDIVGSPTNSDGDRFMLPWNAFCCAGEECVALGKGWPGIPKTIKLLKQMLL